jgi:dipeptide/tripeptide permease
VLTLLDTLMHEYGWSLEYALWQVALATGFALYAAIDARYGNDPKGPTYVEREMIEALEKVSPSQ